MLLCVLRPVLHRYRLIQLAGRSALYVKRQARQPALDLSAGRTLFRCSVMLHKTCNIGPPCWKLDDGRCACLAMSI
jgi:hypothetical protein